MNDLPAVLARWVRQPGDQGKGLGFNLDVRRLERLEEHIDRSSNRVAMALAALGLYIAGSLLSEHSIGPRIFGEFSRLRGTRPCARLWFTFRLAPGIGRSARL